MSKLVQNCLNRFKLVQIELKMPKLVQTFPNWIQLVQKGSQISSNFFKPVQIGSNLSKVDEACQNWLKIESNWFKCAQNRLKFVQTFQNQNVQRLGPESSFQSFLAGKAHFHKGTHNVLISIVKSLQRVPIVSTARLAQSVEHETLNLRVVGSSPTLGDLVLQGSFLGLRFKRKPSRWTLIKSK